MSVEAGLVTAVLVGVGGLAVLVGRVVPLLRAGRAGREVAGHATRPLPTVSVIVPARNEAHNLPALLASLARLRPEPSQVIVVDDHSTDGTGALARAAGATVIVPPPLPAGWLGKPWACLHGAKVATGELLLFTDADTVHAPDSLGRAAELVGDEVDLVSIVPTHVLGAWWEALQGVFQVLLLVATAASADLRRRAGGARRFCIGQYLLFRRSAYDAWGGHTAVRDRVAEDLVFARLARDRYRLLVAPSLLNVRMYPEGLGAFLRGWRRNFREGLAAAGAAGLLEVTAVVGALLQPVIGMALAASSAALGPLVAWGAVYLLVALVMAALQAVAGRFRLATALAYPLFTSFFVIVTALAGWDRLRRAPVVWRGRAVSRAALGR